LLASLVDEIPIGAVIWRIEHPTDGGQLRMVRPNRAASIASSINLRPFIGMTMAEAFPPFVESGAPDHMLAATANGEVCRLGLVEYEDAKIPNALNEVTAYRLDDNHLVVQYSNVSERERLLKSLEERNKELRAAKDSLEVAFSQLEMFTRIASHDLRAPARQVEQLCRLAAAEAEVSDDVSELLKLAAHSARNMTQLIDALLAYTRAQSGEIEREPTGVTELFDAAQYALNAVVDETGANVTWTGVDAVVWGPVRLLEQLLINLVGNAVKFARKGHSATVQINATIDGACVRLDVADDGVGVPESKRAAIFEPFVRAAGGAYPGTGLGLAFCKQLVERMGGRIEMRPGEEVGSVFSVWLPVAADAN